MGYKKVRKENTNEWLGEKHNDDCCATCKKRTYIANTWVCEIDKGEIYPKDKCPNYTPRF